MLFHYPISQAYSSIVFQNFDHLNLNISGDKELPALRANVFSCWAALMVTEQILMLSQIHPPIRRLCPLESHRRRPLLKGDFTYTKTGMLCAISLLFSKTNFSWFLQPFFICSSTYIVLEHSFRPSHGYLTFLVKYGAKN